MMLRQVYRRACALWSHLMRDQLACCCGAIYCSIAYVIKLKYDTLITQDADKNRSFI